jgi:hypothetical protein
MPEADPTTKIVVALNKQLEPGRALNAAAHAVLGLAAGDGEATDVKERFQVIDYPTADANGFLASALPLIVLRAKPAHLKRLLGDLHAAAQPAVAFHSAMTEGTWEDQVARSAGHSIADLELYAVATIGAAERIDPLTKRCSLY